jgi:hypothetical protein
MLLIVWTDTTFLVTYSEWGGKGSDESGSTTPEPHP